MQAKGIDENRKKAGQSGSHGHERRKERSAKAVKQPCGGGHGQQGTREGPDVILPKRGHRPTAEGEKARQNREFFRSEEECGCVL